MKKILTALLLIISINSFSQKPTKEDSLLKVEADRFSDSMVKATTISQLSQYLYENVPPKISDEFYRNIWYPYLQQRYNEFLQRKKSLKPKQ